MIEWLAKYIYENIVKEFKDYTCFYSLEKYSLKIKLKSSEEHVINYNLTELASDYVFIEDISIVDNYIKTEIMPFIRYSLKSREDIRKNIKNVYPVLINSVNYKEDFLSYSSLRLSSVNPILAILDSGTLIAIKKDCDKTINISKEIIIDIAKHNLNKTNFYLSTIPSEFGLALSVHTINPNIPSSSLIFKLNEILHRAEKDHGINQEGFYIAMPDMDSLILLEKTKCNNPYKKFMKYLYNSNLSPISLSENIYSYINGKLVTV